MEIKKDARYCMIVESPNKVKTINQILKQCGYTNVFVFASVGHITHIADSGEYNMGIDTKNNFKADYKITPGKSDVVKKLKEQVKMADYVILATDGDREGEAISYHLKEELKIPEKKLNRIVYHEVTKAAILKAIKESRKIDYDLVAAAVSREKADKIIGYRLSGIARNNVGARSVGRCQSAGLKLIVQREEEILNFKPEKYFDLYLHFKKNKTEFKAKYTGTDKKEVKSLPSLDACKKVVTECKKGNYSILNITHKDSLENPKPPFTTSTFQQEVSKKLGISVKSAMECAQKLFEGINVGGSHISLITYIRTDDATYAPEFLPVLEAFVKNKYGKDYYAPVKFGKKGENSQEGHEGIRCIDLEMTPERLRQHITDEKLLKVYSIIYNRTVASSMKPAVIANTIYTIANGAQRFSMTSKELKFEGYRAAYSYGADDKDEDDQIVRESFKEGEVLKDTSLEAIEKETRPPARFDESSFIKELDKQGIGRPSTYATILQVLLDDKRGYCKVEEKKIVPTNLGMNLSHFLDKSFPDVINIKYTAELEHELDLIAKGNMDSITFLETFYKALEAAIAKVSPESNQEKVCPECGKAMKIRKGKYGLFWGCTGYPECTKIESIKKNN